MPTYEELDKYMRHIKPIEIIAIIPPKLPQSTKFDITSIVIQLLNLKDSFLGLSTDNANMYFINVAGIYPSYNILWVSQESLTLRILPFSQTGEEILWLG